MKTKKIISTDDFDPKKFRPHGRVYFSRDGNILICEAFGPFNIELVTAIGGVAMGLIEELKVLDKWADIVVINESALASSDALQAFTDYLIALGKSNLHSTVTALVIDDDVEGAATMTSHIIDAYIDAGVNITAFKNLNDAKVFVKLHL